MRSGFVEQNSTNLISSCSAREVKLRYTSLTEAYRSGHNEAVLKTVWGQPHGGSNPSASANAKAPNRVPFCVAEAELC